ncbi:MAG: hypothetical protein OEV44_01850 [Spirochaetota bacterium]|nr:hypothetical protein [Spirochaetota bacterium]
MKLSNILAVCKYSKLEYDKRKFNLTTESLINKYKQEQIQYEVIVESHDEQQKCIQLAKDLLPNVDFLYTDELNKELTENKELIISIGGDEHFKYAIHNSLSGKLVLNVRSDNLKSEGALSSCNRFNLEEMIDQIKSDSYMTEEWVRLEAELNNKPIESAIDTIYVGEKNATRMSRYHLYYKDQTEEQKSSGILIVTGAGSTGWFSSAGGNPFPRDANTGRFLIREIYHGTKSGNTLRKGEFNHSEHIKIISLMDEEGIVEIDSIKEYPFKRGNQLKVKVSNEYLRVIIRS